MPEEDALGSPVSMILAIDEMETLFAAGFVPGSVKDLGYDIRLGRHVTRVTRGKIEELEPGDSVKIWPGETILAESLECLRLPPKVCATGSPKMRLLIKGLWSHGGKTDFGFDSNLQLGFVNHGTEPITLSHGEPIFNVIFWHVDGPTKAREGRPVPQPSHISPSRLEALHYPTHKYRLGVLKRDGMQAFRLVTLLQAQYRRLATALIWAFVGLLLMTVGAVLSLVVPETARHFFWSQLVVAILALVGTATYGFLSRSGPGEADTVESIEEEESAKAAEDRTSQTTGDKKT